MRFPNRTINVNLRKELVCSRAIHAPLIFKEKRHNELREDERRYSRPVRYLRCWDKKVQLGNRTLCVNLRKELVCSRAIHCASYIQRKEAQ